MEAGWRLPGDVTEVRPICRLLLAVALGTLLTATTATGKTLAVAATSCENPGANVPIILVHGMNSDPSDFISHVVNGDQPLETALHHLPGVHVEAPIFDYAPESLDWVTNSNIGSALASDITCVANASRAGGGPGKVILVTHSMGGLAAREALSLSSDAAADVGLPITIAAPNSGSWDDGLFHTATAGLLGPNPALISWAIQGGCGLSGTGSRPGPCGILQGATSQAGTAMVPGSAELADLPPPPQSIPLDEVAGDAAVTTQLFGGPTLTLIPHGWLGDLLVKSNSALLYAGRPGVNTYTASCSMSVSQLFSSDAGWMGCEHGGLLYDQAVTDHIQRWIDSYLSALRAQPFVGQWGVHDGGVVINGDGTGSLSFYFGFVTPNPGVSADATEAFSYTVSATRTLTGTITGIRYYTYTNTSSSPAQQTVTGIPGIQTHWAVGDQFTLNRVAIGLLITRWIRGWVAQHGNLTGNPYFCGSGISTTNQIKCGA